jgi:hypothetical protein
VKRIPSLLFGLGLIAVAVAGRPLVDERALMDSLRQMPRWEQVRWLAKRGLADPYLRDCTPVQDSGIRCVGRWSYGPSTWVDVRATADDTIVFLSRGSGVSIIRFRSQDSLRLDLLSDINSHGLTGRCQVRDTLLYVNSGGVECYDISNLTSPVLLNWLSQPLIYDFFVVDTLLYTSSRDSFRVFSVANPASPRWLGACADSGYVMYVSGEYAYLGHQAGLFILDVSNPASPHRVASLGYDVLSVLVKDTLCYFGTTEFALHIYNIKDPTSPVSVGSLSGIEAHDLYISPTCDTVLYTPKLHVINIADPRNPRQIGFVDCPGWDYGVSAVPALNYALVADYFKGMVAVNVTQPTTPTVDTMLFAGDEALDIYLDGGKAYVASYLAGLQILDVSAPTTPAFLGCYDTAGDSRAVSSAAARDSFAFVSWNVPRMLSIDVTDPRHPLRAAGCDGMFNQPEDMVIRDSFVYCVEASRFQIVNVARPREPVLVGSCAGDGVAVVVQDTVAYTAAGAIRVTNIARPDSPFVVSTIAGHSATGLAVNDTFLYVPYVYDTLFTYSVSNPAQPRLLSAVQTGVWPWDVTLGESKAYVALSDGNGIDVFDLASPGLPVRRGRASAPADIRRLFYSSGLVYAAMWEAGVALYETTSVGIQEQPPTAEEARVLRVWPNVTSGNTRFTVGATARSYDIAVYDISGKRLRDVCLQANVKGGATEGEIGLAHLPAGVYVVRVDSKGTNLTAKVVRTKGR